MRLTRVKGPDWFHAPLRRRRGTQPVLARLPLAAPGRLCQVRLCPRAPGGRGPGSTRRSAAVRGGRPPARLPAGVAARLRIAVAAATSSSSFTFSSAPSPAQARPRCEASRGRSWRGDEASPFRAPEAGVPPAGEGSAGRCESWFWHTTLSLYN